MTKYRIISREDVSGEKYFAQRRFFWKFWIDLPDISISGFGQYKEGCETPSRTLKLVENYVESLIHTQKFLSDFRNILEGEFINTQKVVKTYD